MPTGKSLQRQTPRASSAATANSAPISKSTRSIDLSKAVEGLEVRRVKRAFDEIRKAWWWFDASAKLAHTDNPVAWQWELLRRSDTYNKFYKKADAIRVRDETDRSLAGYAFSAACLADLRTLAGSYSRLGKSDPCHKWPDLLFARCAPDLWWTAMPEQSRAIVASFCPLHPRADNAETFSSPFGLYLVAEAVIVERLPSREEKLTSVETSASTAINGKHHGAEILPTKLDRGAYIVVIFDSRFTERILTELTTKDIKLVLKCQINKLQQWLKDIQWPRISALKSFARVLPSNEPDRCQAWIPADAQTNADEVLSTFRTHIGSRKRREWQPMCNKVWRALSPAYSADSLAPVKSKPARVDDPTHLQFGLCAYDCRMIEPCFTAKGLLIPFLRQFPSFTSFAERKLLRDSMKQISRLIDFIDSFYSVSSPSTDRGGIIPLQITT